MKITKVLVRCFRCEGWYHNKCSGASRRQIEGEIRNGVWRRKRCAREIERNEAQIPETEEEISKAGKGDRSEWRQLNSDVLRILQWNADGLLGKKAELEEFLERKKVDVAVIQETKWDGKTATPVIRGFTAVRKDRVVIRRGEEMKGGGLVTLVRRCIPFRRLKGWRGGTTEGLSVVLDCSRKERCTITNVYRPPIRRIRGEDERRHTKVREWLRSREDELVLGDFNLHSSRWGSDEDQGRVERAEATEVLRWCEENGYGILNDGRKTCMDRRTGRWSVPDVSLAAGGLLRRCTWQVVDELGSDHKPIIIEVKVEREGRKEKKVLSWAWKKANWAEYSRELDEKVRMMDRMGSLTDRVARMTDMMIATARKCIPRKKVSCRNRPFWDEELTDLKKERDELSTDGERRVEWMEKNHELKEKIQKKKEAFWRKFVEELSERDARKAWKTIKSLSTGNKGEAPNEILNVEGREARTDLQKAKSFMASYAAVSKLKLGKEDRKKKVDVMRRLREYQEEEEEFGKEFNDEELGKALEHLDEKKKGGPDGIEAAMMKRLGEEAKREWLAIFNHSWNEGRCTGDWKKAIIIPILKTGKDPKERASYRPVSLTSVCVKVMERMVVGRLYYWLEARGVINGWQAGFQRGRSTEEQVVRMVQGVQDGFERRGGHHKTLVVTLDCSKAFDRVWKARLFERLMEEKVPSPLVRWYKNFLEGRLACVRIGSTTGAWKPLKEGLPQGAVSSPALFLLYANDWKDHQIEGVEYSGFADDVALWCTGRRVDKLAEKMQKALGEVDEWAKVNKIDLNPQKCNSCLFTRDAREKDRELDLVVGGGRISP